MAEWVVWVCPECLRAEVTEPLGGEPLCADHQGTPKNMIAMVPRRERDALADALREIATGEWDGTNGKAAVAARAALDKLGEATGDKPTRRDRNRSGAGRYTENPAGSPIIRPLDKLGEDDA